MIKFYCDGACKGNPGPGGFGVISLQDNSVFYSYSEHCEQTTNNREELKAILHIFEISALYEGEPIVIYSDSAYCVNIINDWIYKWANNNWKNSKGKEIENLDLIQQIYKYINIDFFSCQVVKIKGHVGILENELADALATRDLIKYNKLIKENGITNTIS